jgi:broad specificity phosphatase PhoE
MRHGTTDLNAANCYRGMQDVSLDKVGEDDAREIAWFLRDIGLCPYVLMSDMRRTAETLHIINQERKKAGLQRLVGRPTPRLRPLNVGDLSGQPRTLENQKIIQYHADHPDTPFPGGASLNEFRHRVDPVLNNAVELAQQVGQPVGVLGHSSIVHEVGQMVRGDHEAVIVCPGGIAVVCWDPEESRFDAQVVLKPDKGRAKRRADIIS